MSRPDASGVTIRRADAADAPLLEALARQIWAPHYTPIIGFAQVDYMLNLYQSESTIRRDIENGYVYDIAFVDGGACGYSATRGDEDTCFLSKLYVRDDCRGRGIARMLVSRTGLGPGRPARRVSASPATSAIPARSQPTPASASLSRANAQRPSAAAL